MLEGPIELASFDRDVRRVEERVERLHEMLLSPEGRAQARFHDPFGNLRHTAVQGSYRALKELKPSELDVPLRDALVRWTYELLQERIGQDLTVDDAEAVFAVDERIARPSQRVATPSAPSDRPESAATYADAGRAILVADGASRAAIALDRAGELAAPVAAVRKERRERRFEAARRLGLEHPFALTTAHPIRDLTALARTLLDRTEPLAEEILREARRRSDVPWTAASAMHLALARDAVHGWPAHLGVRWLTDAFDAVSARAPRSLAKLPVAIGGASFLRAAFAWGFAVRLVGTARTLPFSLARDPYPAAAHRFGFAFAAAVAEPAFQRRILDLPTRLASAQSRALRTSLFVHMRTQAARFLLASTERVDDATFEELGTRVFGAPLPGAMKDAWPEPRVDEAARFLALLSTNHFIRGLVQRFDEDWFRNPRAGSHLASLACAPMWDDEPTPENAVADLGRAFEEALG